MGGGKYRLEEKLGQGSFGMIFRCIHLDSGESYAMKLEKRSQRHSSMLVREIKVMIELKKEAGYARMVSYGKEDDYNFVVMTSLGRNLDNIVKKCGQKFTLATCSNIADQMLTRLEVLHSHNLIHRDIKPENFVIGADRNYPIVYLIDFGLAKYFK